MRYLVRAIVVLAVLIGLVAVLDRALPGPMARYSIAIQRGISHLEAKRTQIPGGFDIAYLEGGKGDPLVLVHGIGADKDNFDRVAMLLTRHYRVIALDMPGFGESSKPADADYRVDAQVGRLDQFLDALKLDVVHLGGSSMGGWIVAAYAAAHPQRVQSLWLLGPAGIRDAKESEVRRAYHESGKYLLFAQNPEEYERIMDIVFAHRPFVPYSVRHELAARAAANYDLHTSIFRALIGETQQPPLDGLVKDLPTPALIVFGDHDRAVDPSAGETLHRLMPHSQLIVLPDVGHLPMLEEPNRTARDYLEFRAGLEPVIK
jgi:abhydrolase domain-containing protein 6